MHQVVDQVEEQRDKVEHPAYPQQPANISWGDGAELLSFILVSDNYLNVFHDQGRPDCQPRKQMRIGLSFLLYSLSTLVLSQL